MKINKTSIPGCYLLRADVFGDARGRLAKSYVPEVFEQHGLRTDWQEELHSSSRRGVVRGMHFQTPPEGQTKLVYCVAGEVIDVILDLRAGSPTFGQHRAFSLSAESGAGIYVPTGCAHGFAAIGEVNILFYKTTGAYSPPSDAGIALDSFGFKWPFADPILSDRDRRHPRLNDFDSPFAFDPEAPGK